MNERNDTMEGENERDDGVECSRCDGSGVRHVVRVVGRKKTQEEVACPRCKGSDVEREETEVNDTQESSKGEGVERFYVQSQTVFDRETGDRWTQPHASFAESLARAMNALVEQGRQQERERVEVFHLKCVDCGGEEAVSSFAGDASFPHFRNCPTLAATQNPDKDSVEGDDCVECAERPTGTIFELDLFRERLERRADEIEGAVETIAIPRAVVASELSGFAAELKTLIDNCQRQYAPADQPTRENPDKKVCIPEPDTSKMYTKSPPQPVGGERYVVDKITPDADWCYVKDTVLGTRASDTFGPTDDGPNWLKKAHDLADRFNRLEAQHQQALLAAERERVVARIRQIVEELPCNVTGVDNRSAIKKVLLATLTQQEGE